MLTIPGVLARELHVGLNAMFLEPGASGGPETYLRGLAPALARERPALRLSVVTTRKGAAALRGDGWNEWASVEQLPADEGQQARRALAEQVLLPRLARRRGFDLLHSLASVAPIRAGVPSVITLHDVSFFRHRTFRLSTTLAMRFFVSRAARRADALVAVSAAARDDICEVLELDRADFVVAYNGARPPPARRAAGEDSVRARLGLDGRRTILCVAAKRPHKNQELLVRALAHLPDDISVCCVGRDEGYGERLRDVAGTMGVEERVALPAYLPQPDLDALWTMADCAAFPTLAEGFGMPVVEAMQRSLPVACSDIPVLREVAGDAARFFDPHDPAAAARAIEAAMADEAAPARGRERAHRFTWESAARATLEAYDRALAGRP